MLNEKNSLQIVDDWQLHIKNPNDIIKKLTTYTCPNSWAIVNAADKPLSWTIAQENGLHIVPNSANPNVSHFISVGLRQICSLNNKLKHDLY